MSKPIDGAGGRVPNYPNDETNRLIHEAKWGKTNEKPLFEKIPEGAQELAQGAVNAMGTGLGIFAKGVITVFNAVEPTLSEFKGNVNELAETFGLSGNDGVAEAADIQTENLPTFTSGDVSKQRELDETHRLLSENGRGDFSDKKWWETAD